MFLAEPLDEVLFGLRQRGALSLMANLSIGESEFHTNSSSSHFSAEAKPA